MNGSDPQQQQQWMAMQYPAATVMMQQQMVAAHHYPPQQFLPYHHHHQQPPQQQQGSTADENKTIWVGDLHYWMDENYLHTCFGQTGEVFDLRWKTMIFFLDPLVLSAASVGIKVRFSLVKSP